MVEILGQLKLKICCTDWDLALYGCLIDQEIGNVNLFLYEANQRLLDIDRQNWHPDLAKSSN